MRRFYFFVMLLCTSAFAESTYQKGRLLAINDSVTWQKLSTGGRALLSEVYQLNVRVGDIVYVGKLIPWPYGYRPKYDLTENSDVDVRIDGNSMHIKRPNGKEFNTKIVKRLDRTGKEEISSSDPKKTASKHDHTGVDLAEGGDIEGAENQFRSALRFNAENADAHFHLGKVLAQRRDHEGAVAEARTAVRLDPKHAEAHCLIGVMSLDKGDLENALDELATAVRLDWTLTIAHYEYGMALETKGELSKALKEFRVALDRDDYDMDFQNAVARVKKKLAATAQ